MVDMNNMKPAELRAAIQGGTAGWGQVASATENVRYKLALPKIKARRQCHCGCEGKATHVGMANGIGLTRGCEMSMQRWVTTGQSKPQRTAAQQGTTP